MKKLSSLLLLCCLLGSVAAQTIDDQQCPNMGDSSSFSSVPHTPRVGLVLGGGGAKGAAHIGVLKYMEEIGIPISYVAGTSMGSIIGGLYALGYSPDELADLIAHMDWNFYMSNNIERENLSVEQRERKCTELLSIPFNFGDVRDQRQDLIGSLPSGAINSSNLLNLFNRLCIGYQNSMDFNDLPIPFACIATDLLSGDSVILNKGEFAKAIRSSMSIPGVFAPVEWNNRMLADGGMVNNFPADVCKEMGADIIIGVEIVSKPITDSDSLRSLPQQLMQYLTIATQGHNAENRKLCNIYVTPDVTGYNMLSFSTENIDTLVQRGYRQAKLHKAEFMALKTELEKYGPCKKTLQCPPAKKLMPGDKIKLRDINYKGVPTHESIRLLALNYIKPNVTLDIEELEKAANRLRGTGKYLYAHYKLIPAYPQDSMLRIPEELYDIEIELIPAKPHTLGLGFRFDSEESAEVLLHLGWNEQKAGGFKAFVDVDFAYNFGFSTLLSWSKKGSGELNFKYRYKKSAHRIINWGAMQSYWNNLFQLYYSNRAFNNLTIMAGLQQEFFIDADFRSWKGIISPDLTEINDSYKTLSLFTEINYDNMDDKYFANNGMDFNINAAIYKGNKDFFKKEAEPFAAARISWKTYIPINQSFTLVPQLSGRALFNYDNAIDHIWYCNVIGGAFDSRYLDQQLAFIGFNNVYSTSDLLAIARLDLRYQITSKDYISLIANAYTTTNGEEVETKNKNDNVLGVGVRLAHKSIFGPIWLDVAWNSLTNHFCGFLNAGFFF